jgi:hypothetical protein
MLKNSVLKAGNSPISKSELVNKNLKQFIRYINTMDLEKFKSLKELNMNTYNRNVFLNKHVVLLSLIEHAEDLIKNVIVYCLYLAPYTL